MSLLVAGTIVAVAALLAAEARGSRAGIWIAKPLASAGFVAVALAAGAPDSPYGRWILAGLVLAWWGDVLLIPRSRAVFLAGIASFLLGHVAYGIAFVERGVSTTWVALAAVVLVGPALGVWRWLRGHVPAAMRGAVRAYVGVISAMVACAVGTFAEAGGAAILVGALMFFVSDLAVARNRFVAPGFVNKTWGLPLYYGGQLLLAASVG